MTAPLRPYTPWSHLDRKGNARIRRIEQTSEARYAAVMAEAERINAAFRNQTPEQLAARELYRLISQKTDMQFDVDGEAADQGMSTVHYVRSTT